MGLLPIGITMLTSFISKFRRKKPEPTLNLNLYDTVIHHLGELHEINQKTFSPAKARTVRIQCATENLDTLGHQLIEAALFVSKGNYLPAKWKVPLSTTRSTLEQYITEDRDLIHPLDWIEDHRHHIMKLVDAIQAMERADAEYYQRKCNFIISDIIALAEASRLCLR